MFEAPDVGSLWAMGPIVMVRLEAGLPDNRFP